MGITQGVAEFALRGSIADIPDDVVKISKEMMLNGVGVGIAGSTAQASVTVLDYVAGLGGTDDCTILASDQRSTAEFAALANGTMVHVLDFDETFERRGNHPTASIYSAVMALGERDRCTGQSVLEAFVVGCEISTKIGAIGDLDELKSTLFKHGWHLSGVGGTIGAAVAAGRLLQLTQLEMENCLGIAVSLASGLQVNYGHGTKSLHAGRSAMNGITAATLAKKGLTGARNGIEAADGFLGAFRGDVDVDAEKFLAQLGNPYDVIYPGVGVKYYPCATTTHASIFAVEQLVREHSIRPEDVQALHVSVPALGGVTARRNAFPHPRTGLEGKFSVPYAAAVALVFGTPRMHHFTDEAVQDPRIRPILDRLVLTMDEVPTIEYHMPATVRITLTDGRVVEHRALSAKGHPSNPMTTEDLDDKFISCTQEAMSAEAIERTISGFRNLESNPDVRDLFASLGVAAHRK